MKTQDSKKIYRQSLGVKLSKAADQRVWNKIEGELQKQSSRGTWFQFGLTASILCALLVVILVRNIPEQTEVVELSSTTAEIDQVSDVAFEIDEELAATQILAYDDYEGLGVGAEYDF